MKKILSLFIVIITMVTFSGCTSGSYKDSVSVGKINVSNMETIASIPEEKIYLYASNKENTMYKGLVLSINGDTKSFDDWETISLIEDLPELYYIDLTNDQKKELVIRLSKGRGTGSVKNTIHIVNPDDFTEYKIEDPQNVMKSHVETKIITENKVDIIIDNKKLSIDLDKLPPEVPMRYPEKVSEITYDNFIDYQIRDDTIQCTVGVEGDFLQYLGYISFEYTFKDDKFIATNLQFSISL